VSEPTLAAAATLRDAIAAIERTRRLIAAVIDADGRLLGILSDGDIRRAILSGKELDSPAADVMTRSPIVASSRLTDQGVLHTLMLNGVAAAPVIDDQGRLVRIAQTTDYRAWPAPTGGGKGFAAAVIMAGGEGRRLMPFTADRPKPMIDIGGVPLLERQVRAIVASGLKRIFISTNYLGHIIESHFGDGADLGAEISYLREGKKLGTAGALSLLPKTQPGPLLVLNGDILTRSDFGKLFAYHSETHGFITVAAVAHQVVIPFGVLRLEGDRAVGLEEKPSQTFLCNAGIYVLEADALSLVPRESRIDMTDIISAAIDAGETVSVFPIHEYWTDVGNPADLERAMAEFC